MQKLHILCEKKCNFFQFNVKNQVSSPYPMPDYNIYFCYFPDQLLEVAILRNVIKKNLPAMTIPDTLRTRIGEASTALNLQDTLTLSTRSSDGQANSWEEDMIATLTNTITSNYRNVSNSPAWFRDNYDAVSGEGSTDEEDYAPPYDINDNYYPDSEPSMHGNSSDDDHDVDVETLSNEAMTQGTDSEAEQDNDAISPPQSFSEDDDNEDHNRGSGGVYTSEEEDRHHSDSDQDRGWGGSDSDNSRSDDSPGDHDHNYSSHDDSRHDNSSPEHDNSYNSDAEDNEGQSDGSGSAEFSPPEHSDNERGHSESDRDHSESDHGASSEQDSPHTISSGEDSNHSYRANSTHTVSSGVGSPHIISSGEESSHTPRHDTSHSRDESEVENSIDENEEASPIQQGSSTNDEDSEDCNGYQRRSPEGPFTARREPRYDSDSNDLIPLRGVKFHITSNRSPISSSEGGDTSDSEVEVVANENRRGQTSPSFSSSRSRQRRSPAASPNSSNGASSPSHLYSGSSFEDHSEKDSEDEVDSNVKANNAEENSDKDNSKDDESDNTNEDLEVLHIASSDFQAEGERSSVIPQSVQPASPHPATQDRETFDNTDNSEAGDERDGDHDKEQDSHSNAGSSPAHSHNDLSEGEIVDRSDSDGQHKAGHQRVIKQNNPCGRATSPKELTSPNDPLPKVKEERCSEGSFEPDYTESESEDHPVPTRRKKRMLKRRWRRSRKSASQEERKNNNPKVKLPRRSESFPRFDRIVENSGSSSEQDVSEGDAERANRGSGEPDPLVQQSMVNNRPSHKPVVTARRQIITPDGRLAVVGTKLKKESKEPRRRSLVGRKRRPSSPSTEREPKRSRLPVSLSMPNIDS